MIQPLEISLWIVAALGSIAVILAAMWFYYIVYLRIVGVREQVARKVVEHTKAKMEENAVRHRMKTERTQNNMTVAELQTKLIRAESEIAKARAEAKTDAVVEVLKKRVKELELDKARLENEVLGFRITGGDPRWDVHQLIDTLLQRAGDRNLVLTSPVKTDEVAELIKAAIHDDIEKVRLLAGDLEIQREDSHKELDREIREAAKEGAEKFEELARSRIAELGEQINAINDRAENEGAERASEFKTRIDEVLGRLNDALARLNAAGRRPPSGSYAVVTSGEATPAMATSQTNDIADIRSLVVEVASHMDMIKSRVEGLRADQVSTMGVESIIEAIKAHLPGTEPAGTVARIADDQIEALVKRLNAGIEQGCEAIATALNPPQEDQVTAAHAQEVDDDQVGSPAVPEPIINPQQEAQAGGMPNEGSGISHMARPSFPQPSQSAESPVFALGQI